MGSLIKRKPTEAAEALRLEPLHVRLRPRTFGEVIGHDVVCAALKKLLNSKSPPHSFLFTGQSGAGKTTLARIVGRFIGCEPTAVIQIDAARYSGVDNMREIILGSAFAALSKNGKKAIVIEECHMLSKGAWNSLLLSVEEPPEHLFWIFCTTEPEKVPATIRNRCQAFDLKSVAWELITDYLTTVVASEGLTVPPEIRDVIARGCGGSIRQALVHLAAVNGVTEKVAALHLIESVDSEQGTGFQLAQMVCTGRGFAWDKVKVLLEALKEENQEGVRLVVVNYAAKMLLSTNDPKEAARLMNVLASFSVPYNQSEKQAPLILSVGSLLFS